MRLTKGNGRSVAGKNKPDSKLVVCRHYFHPYRHHYQYLFYGERNYIRRTPDGVAEYCGKGHAYHFRHCLDRRLLLFCFLENALNRTENVRDELAGNLWAVHGGGFYYLENIKAPRKPYQNTCTGSSTKHILPGSPDLHCSSSFIISMHRR